MPDYRSGSIWLIKFEPQIGTEIKKTRPGLIISKSSFNSKRTKITVLPFTSFDSLQKNKAARVTVRKSNQNGLDKDSEIITIDPATFDKKRLIEHIGQIDEKLLLKVKEKLRIYLDL